MNIDYLLLNEYSDIKKLKHIFKRYDRRSYKILNLLIIDWPISKLIINNLISFVPLGIYIKHEVFVYKAVKDALSLYEIILLNNNNNKYQDSVRIIFFVDFLIKEIYSYTNFEISYKKNNIDYYWNLLSNKKKFFVNINELCYVKCYQKKFDFKHSYEYLFHKLTHNTGNFFLDYNLSKYTLP